MQLSKPKKLISKIVMITMLYAFGQEVWACDRAENPNNFPAVGCLYEGLAAVKSSNKWGYVDYSGRVVIPIKYDDANRYSEGLASVKKYGKWGFINHIGRVIIGFNFDYAGDFTEGLALVINGNKRGFIDKSGKVVIPIQYRDAYSFKEGLAAVGNNGKWGFIDKTGRVVVPLKYDDASSISRNGFGGVKFHGKWYAVNRYGRFATCESIKFDSLGIPHFEGCHVKD